MATQSRVPRNRCIRGAGFPHFDALFRQRAARWAALLLFAAVPVQGQQTTTPATPPVTHLGSRVLNGSGRIEDLRLNMQGDGEANDRIDVFPSSITSENPRLSAWEHQITLVLPQNLDALGRVTIAVKKPDGSATKRVFTMDLKATMPAITGVAISHGLGPAQNLFQLPASGNLTYNVTLTGGPFHSTDSLYFSDPGLTTVPGSISFNDPSQLNAQVRVAGEKLPAPGPVVAYVTGAFRTGAATYDMRVRSASDPVVHTLETIRLAAGTTVTTVLAGSNLYPEKVSLRRGGVEIGVWEVLTSTPTSITVRGLTPNTDEPLELVVVNRDQRERVVPVVIGQNVGEVTSAPADGVRIFADVPTVVRFARRNRPVLPTQDGAQYRLSIGGREITGPFGVIGDTILVATLTLPAGSYPSLNNPASLPVVITGPNKLSWNGALELSYRPNITRTAYSPLFPGGKSTLNVLGEHLQGVTLRPAGPVKLTLATPASPTHLQAEMEVTDEVDPGTVEIEALKDGTRFASFNVDVATRPEFSFVRISIPEQEVSGRFTEVQLRAVNHGDLVRLSFHGDSLPPNVGKQTIKVFLRTDSASRVLEERTVTVRRGQTPEVVLRIPDDLPAGSSARLSLEHSTGERQNTVALPVRKTWDERLRLTAGVSALRWVPSRTEDNSAVGDAFIGAWWDFSPNPRPLGAGIHLVALNQEDGGPEFGFGPGFHFGNLSLSFAWGPTLGSDSETPPAEEPAGAIAPAQVEKKDEGRRLYIIFGGSLSTDISKVFGGGSE